MVFNGDNCVDVIQPYARENRLANIAIPRSAELRIYKRVADCYDVLRFHGQKENHADNGYVAFSNGNVSPRSVSKAAKAGYEIPVLPVDKIRERIAKVYGIRQGVQFGFNSYMDGTKA